LAALLLGRQPPDEHIEQDHERAGDQGQANEAEADQQRIDAGIVGEPGGDAHDLGVAPVDQETSVHFKFSLRFGVQAIGSDVAAETSKSADTSAPARMVAVSRAETKEANIVTIPFALEPDHRVHATF